MLLLAAFVAPTLQAQIHNPAKWRKSVTNTPQGEVTVTLEVALESGWHIYDVTLPEGGPTPTAIELDGSKAVQLVGTLTAEGKLAEVYDPNFDMKLRWYNGKAKFVQKFQIENPNDFAIAGDIIYMLCNDQTCLPPPARSLPLRKPTSPLRYK